MKRLTTGFTLVELLIVIAVLGVLVSLTIGVSGTIRWKARVVTTTARMQSVIDGLRQLGQLEGSGALALQRDAQLDGVVIFNVVRTSAASDASMTARDLDSDGALTSPGEIPLDYASSHHFRFPWGRKSDGNNDGHPPYNAAPEAKTVQDLSPEKTIDLLKISEILPNTADKTQWSTGGKSSVWVDAWGNPLVVSYGVYQPTFSSDAASMLRMQGHKREYLHNRAVYVAVGSVGPVVSPSIDWTGGQAFEKLWEQVTEVCTATDWDAAAWNSPPWDGVREGTRGSQHSFLTAPVEIR